MPRETPLEVAREAPRARPAPRVERDAPRVLVDAQRVARRARRARRDARGSPRVPRARPVALGVLRVQRDELREALRAEVFGWGGLPLPSPPRLP